ncbi:hypothetical protein SmJEL517_g01247 [Synchytrium microbalum]|uniref:RNA helicase n=1 Tax=Synchytrium microbalum TaxID=1806994 RepID=A0A507CFX7_9FUNG|nr:uncharacterized protein SmJEL517_g01247 [Synchytrium microbalum]TPX36485.1 hypothetical protein SmJEL517_g01247 [Synchytrium microbalum]
MKPSTGFVKKPAVTGRRPFSALEEDDDDDSIQQQPKRKLPPLTSTSTHTTQQQSIKSSSNAYDPASNTMDQDDDDDDDWKVDKKPTINQHFVKAGSTTARPSIFSSERSPSANPPPAAAADDDEDDLDAFMAGIDQQVKQEASLPKRQTQQQQIMSFDDDDNVEDYIKFMKSKGLEVGKSGVESGPRPDDDDSDDEVYRAAAAIDAANEDPSMARVDALTGDKRKDIEPLPQVDHSKIEYPELEKNFYEPHADIASLTPDKVREIRAQFDVVVTGPDHASKLYYPCISFGHFGFDESLISAIAKHGYTEPTGIQRQAVPLALSGKDLIGIAKTGSGKTAAFIWPMLVHIMDQDELDVDDGPIGLILAPTRELAHQIYTETKKFAKVYNLNVSVIYGGASKAEQFKELRKGGIEIIVATPGRLIDMIKMKATNLRRVSYLVLDEADRMFDLGFEPQVRSICNSIRPDRQTLLFSATFPRKIEYLARDVLTEPLKVIVGGVGVVNTDVTQIIQVLPDDSYKWDWLVKQLPRFISEGGSTLVFVGRKAGTDALYLNLKDMGFKCGALHGDLQQIERDTVIADFKASRINVLVCTDVAARGLDIKSVKNVVNYDSAKDLDSHVHRIGRTGRAGEKGTAYSLVTSSEDKFAGDLVRSLEDSNVRVPDDLMALAMKNVRFKQSRSYGGGRGGRGGRGGFRGGRGRGRGGGRGSGRGQSSGGRGGGGGSSNPNMVPLGFVKASHQ